MEGGAAAAAAAKAPPPVGRLTRQGRIDPRLTTSGSFDSFFTAPRNKSRTAQPLVKFQKHSKGQLADRQKHGLNLALWCLTDRRCDCVGNCGCGSLLLCDTTKAVIVSASSTLRLALSPFATVKEFSILQ